MSEKAFNSSDLNNQLTVWIINPYGNIPSEGWRDYRSTLIAKALTDAGYKTIWWVSNFEHRSKTFRTMDWKDIKVNQNFMIRIVPSTRYESHISLKRIEYEKTFSRNLCKRASKEVPPDVIILAEPALFVSTGVLKLIRHWKTKLVVDIMDLWPELFNIILPRRISFLGRILFLPLYLRRAKLFKTADAIVAVTQDYLEVAKKIVVKNISEVIYMGVDVRGIQQGMLSIAELPEILCKRKKSPNEVWAIYAGTLGNNYDIRTILLAAELLAAKKNPVTILIAGDGPLKSEVIIAIERKNLKNLIYVGSLSAQAITNLYKYCDIALSTYISASTVSMPLKIYDYLAAGLPIINSLERELGLIIREKNIGVQYEPENPVSLSSAIEKLALNLEIRKDMSNNAKILALSFDEAKQHLKYVGIIESLTK
jgi:glycosyltransferase involved in cell wall biosynthesis